jgi:ribosomal protein S18 acetylase RimI-like enzyme
MSVMQPVPRSTSEIRPLEPRDLVQVASLHCKAFKDYMNVALGRAYITAMIDWFRRSPEGIAIGVYTEDAKLLGYTVGVPLTEMPRLSRDLLSSAVWGFITHPWLCLQPRFIRRVASRLKQSISKETGAEWGELPEPAMGLFGIAVDPTAQGQGIGGKLIKAFEESARSRGMRSMVLSVYSYNAEAQRLYQNAGWELVPPKKGSTQVCYYTKLL